MVDVLPGPAVRASMEGRPVLRPAGTPGVEVSTEKASVKGPWVFFSSTATTASPWESKARRDGW